MVGRQSRALISFSRFKIHNSMNNVEAENYGIDRKNN